MSEAMKLNLGSFDRIFSGWINTDITPHIWVSKIPFLPDLMYKVGKLDRERYDEHQKGIFRQLTYLDLTKKFPWSDNSVDAAYTSHVLEHLYLEGALNCISEVYRVLKPGGIFRVAVPDLDQLIKSYNPSCPEVFLTEFLEATQTLEKNRHHWHYNENSLRKILLDTGFREVVRCNYRNSQIAGIAEREERPESLFMECIK
ncbi:MULTISPECIES: methyltransferase domain-containing protein [unclassified Coleofasciculus]|uniref:class I SAM-dependent methyltransferase n=2 Tax=Cyanophyceae TaxID=3028117 RepID=UPI001681F219|nr:MULTISPECIES: methyltransferase domain-containing protein [unclassified Coleofasciculus]MBD2087803.1 methyltransferase domain-containing protein [Coleofasciculus sp. FACHB-542]MBD2538898.1 methyltransferase domain-containing protein [Coleofasciculus sp. FACHB-SPT36]